ncbi:UPF0149 family protein [Pseudoxanthomonas composti]|uniref:YecA family protein n=1 Tax=Pseudoxanthomonas composti TaxID=2137479 RepID=A0A4Q1JTF7_9GAMM|nr:UPF0149 family protein [Pseudoxanthomonas composti]RXR04243.1 YecA family protein [Pseudoxanthomonas composti]
MTGLPSVQEVEQAAQRLSLGASASELHGGLCGWLAGGGQASAQWPSKVLADDALAPVPAGSVLETLQETSAQQLEDRSFGFELLLPPSDQGTTERAAALFDWCRGFLGGFGLAAGAKPPLSEEGQEALGDLARLAQAAPETGEEEEDQDALAEIEEFVRVAALLLHSDCVLATRHRQRLN